MHSHTLEEDAVLAAGDHWTKVQLWVSDTPSGADINPAFVLGHPDAYQVDGFTGWRGGRITGDLENPVIDAELRIALGEDETSISPYMTGGALVNGRPLFDPGRYITLMSKSFTPGAVITYPSSLRAIPRFQGVGQSLSGIGAISPAWPSHQTGDVGLMVVETDNQNIGTIPSGWAHVTGSPIGTDGAGAPPVLQVVSTFSASSGGQTKAWPTHVAGDIALLIIESANEVATLSTPAGFVEIPDSPQGTGTAAGVDATRLTVFWCRATSSTMAAPFIADPGDHYAAYMITFRGCIETGNPWDVTAGNVAAAATTAVSIPGDTTTVANCLVVAIVANATETTTAQGSGWTNASLTGLAERADANTASANGGGLTIITGLKAAAGAYSATTGTLVTSSVQGRISLALKPAAAGSGNKTMLSLLWKRAASNSEQALSIGDSGDHQIGQIFTFRGCIASGNPWDIAVAAVQASDLRAVSIPGGTTTVANCLVVQAVTNSTKSQNAQASGWANANLANLAKRWDTQTDVGTGGGHSVVTGEKATAGAFGATTSLLEEASVQALMTVALKPPSGGGGAVELVESDIPWRPVFIGRIDAADPASDDNTLVLQCRDVASDVLDRWIEPTATGVHEIQANDAVDALTQVFALGFPTLADLSYIGDFFRYNGIPNMAIPAYNQQPMSTLLAMREIALLNGWDLRGRFGGNVGGQDAFFLIYYEPDRALTGPQYVIGPDRLYSYRGLTKSRDEVRNKVSVTPSDAPREPVIMDDGDSQTKYGIRYLGVVEDAASRIRSPEQALALATAILSDTKEPKVMAVLDGPYLPFVEVNDVLVMEANGIHFDTDLTLAVSGYTHTFSPDGAVRTSLNTRDLPAAANSQWRAGTPKMEYVSTELPTGIAAEGALWTTLA